MAVLIQGCTAIGPGFAYTDGGLADTRSPDVNPADLAPGDKPPEAAITPITYDLVAKMQAAALVSNGVTPDVMSLLGKTEDYRLGAGDVVGIVVYDHPELVSSQIPATTVADPASISPAPGFIISNTGQLSFPYAGSLKAEGMTVQELENVLTKRLARVFKDPQINVRVQAFRSKRAYIEGEIKTPGLLVFTDIPMTLPEAITRSGGITAQGDRSYVTLTRNGKTTRIDLVALTEAGIDPTRIPLRNGDLLTVRNRDESEVSVMGEVQQPSAVLMRNGRLSLNDALSKVGGPNLGTANPRQIYVIRNEPRGGQSIFHLDARTATALALAEKFQLQPKDVVYVDPVALVMWSRIVNLIIPSTNTANSIRDLRR